MENRWVFCFFLCRGRNLPEWIKRLAEAEKESDQRKALVALNKLFPKAGVSVMRDHVWNLVKAVDGVSFDDVDLDNKELIQALTLSPNSRYSRSRSFLWAPTMQAMLEIVDGIEKKNSIMLTLHVLCKDLEQMNESALVRFYARTLKHDDPKVRVFAIHECLNVCHKAHANVPNDIFLPVMEDVLKADDLNDETKVSLLLHYKWGQYGNKDRSMYGPLPETQNKFLARLKDPKQIQSVLANIHCLRSDIGTKYLIGLLNNHREILDKSFELSDSGLGEWPVPIAPKQSLFVQILDMLDKQEADGDRKFGRRPSGQTSEQSKELRAKWDEALAFLKGRMESSENAIAKRKIERILGWVGKDRAPRLRY